MPTVVASTSTRLPDRHMICRAWVPYIKTTLNIDDTIMTQLKREAARHGRTRSEMVETALRLLLRSHRKQGALLALSRFRAAARSSISPIAMRSSGDGRAVVLAVTHMSLSTPPIQTRNSTRLAADGLSGSAPDPMLGSRRDLCSTNSRA